MSKLAHDRGHVLHFGKRFAKANCDSAKSGPSPQKNTGAISWGDHREVTLQSFVGMFVPIAPFCLRKGSSLIAPGKNGPGE
jgi:hypothetical protein